MIDRHGAGRVRTVIGQADATDEKVRAGRSGLGDLEVGCDLRDIADIGGAQGSEFLGVELNRRFRRIGSQGATVGRPLNRHFLDARVVERALTPEIILLLGVVGAVAPQLGLVRLDDRRCRIDDLARF